MGLWCEADGPVNISVAKLTPTVPTKEPAEGGRVQTPAQGDTFLKFIDSDVIQTLNVLFTTFCMHIPTKSRCNHEKSRFYVTGADLQVVLGITRFSILEVSWLIFH